MAELATDQNTEMPGVRERDPLTSCRPVWRNRSREAGFNIDSRRLLLREVEVSISATLAVGTAVVVDLASFEHVQGASRTVALKAFITRFGKGASGWAFEVGRPLEVGGGACQS